MLLEQKHMRTMDHAVTSLKVDNYTNMIGRLPSDLYISSITSKDLETEGEHGVFAVSEDTTDPFKRSSSARPAPCAGTGGWDGHSHEVIMKPSEDDL